MKKVVLLSACIVSLAAAQKWEFGVSGGWGLPAGTVLAGHTIVIDTDTYAPNTFEEVYSSGGRGWKMTGEALFYPVENLGIMVIAGYSMASSYDTSSRRENGTNLITDTVTTSHIPVALGVKVRTKIGPVEPYVYAASGVVFPAKTDKNFDSSTSTTLTKTYSYSMGFCLMTGAGAAVMVSPAVGIKAEFSPTFAYANPTKYEAEQKSGSGTSKITYTYKDDTPASALGPNEIQDRPHDSFCSMAFKVGLFFRL